MRITVDEAREYFAHPTQQRASGVTPDQLPDDLQYWSKAGVCVAFNRGHWPDVWGSHIAVIPTAWGDTVEPTKAILAAFHAAENPASIMAWVDTTNRALMSFTRRVGYIEVGRIANGSVSLQEYILCQ